MREKKNRKIPKNRWSSYFAQFTHGNRGRPIRINRFEGGSQEKTLEEELPFLSANYDPHHDGLLSIAAGQERIEYEHPVKSPQQVWVAQDTEGSAKSMEILDADGNRTVVTFED